MIIYTPRHDYCSIYLITNTINNKKYVGQTWYSIEQRLVRHSKQNKRGCPYLYRAIAKHGISNFKIETIITTTDQIIADQLEQKYIEQYQTTDKENGYNILGGGQNGRPSMPEEMRQRISDKMTGIKRSAETIQKMIAGHEGYLEKLSPQSKANLEASRAKKRKLTMEQANQIREKYAQGIQLKDLAKEYGVSNAVISFIINNKTYVNDYSEK
jgi:group I intron endonuclease